MEMLNVYHWLALIVSVNTSHVWAGLHNLVKQLSLTLSESAGSTHSFMFHITVSSDGTDSSHIFRSQLPVPQFVLPKLIWPVNQSVCVGVVQVMHVAAQAVVPEAPVIVCS